MSITTHRRLRAVQLRQQPNTDVIKALTRVGIVLYGGLGALVVPGLYRVEQASRTGVSVRRLWEQRVEDLAFIGFLPNLPSWASSQRSLSAATWLAGPTQQLELAILLRLTAGPRTSLIVVARR